MRVALLGPANSIHLSRLANALAINPQNEIHVISAHEYLDLNYSSRVRIHRIIGSVPGVYILGAIEVSKLLRRISAEVLNVHYASGYGLLGLLSGFRPYILSVWGSDIYEFPNRSFLHKTLLKNIMKGASAIASTSNKMLIKSQTIYKHERTFVTPFGIDCDHFRPVDQIKKSNIVVIGTVKSLEHVYGIDILIKTFSEVYLFAQKKGVEVRLEITGSGSEETQLKRYSKDLGVDRLVSFYPAVPHEEVVDKLNRLDIYVALSRLESFGVAILEAASCGLPVLVSDADGPSEIVVHKKTGIIVPLLQPEMIVTSLLSLVFDENMRKDLGAAGRRHVVDRYPWHKSVDNFNDLYRRVLTCD